MERSTLPSDAELAILEEIYPVSRETLEALAEMVERLKVWQKKTNLVAPTTLEDIWRRHVADSLQCLSLFPDAKFWVDLGSGGGFPGLVIAIVMGTEKGPHAAVHLVESITKKCAFLRQTNRSCGGIAKVHCGRIEEELPKIDDIEIVTARALAELPLLLTLSAPALRNGAVGLFHKGRDYQSEVEKCRGLWRFDLIEHKSRIEPDSVLLEIRNLQPDR